MESREESLHRRNHFIGGRSSSGERQSTVAQSYEEFVLCLTRWESPRTHSPSCAFAS